MVFYHNTTIILYYDSAFFRKSAKQKREPSRADTTMLAKANQRPQQVLQLRASNLSATKVA
jgi:hypothetical protein